MNSHELANSLLALPDKPLTVVKSVPGGKGYTEDMIVTSPPWEDLMGHIRVQAHQPGGNIQEGTPNDQPSS